MCFLQCKLMYLQIHEYIRGKKAKGKKRQDYLYPETKSKTQVKIIKKNTRRQKGNKTPRKANLQNKKRNNQKTDKRGLSQVSQRLDPNTGLEHKGIN